MGPSFQNNDYDISEEEEIHINSKEANCMEFNQEDFILKKSKSKEKNDQTLSPEEIDYQLIPNELDYLCNSNDTLSFSFPDKIVASQINNNNNKKESEGFEHNVLQGCKDRKVPKTKKFG